MNIQIFAIHDSKAHAYLQPFFLHNKEMAIRSFTSACNDKDTQFNQHPLDYTLFHIGTYNDEIGLVTPEAPPTMLTTADQCITYDPKITEKETDNV